jgi:hypothetical protein
MLDNLWNSELEIGLPEGFGNQMGFYLSQLATISWLCNQIWLINYAMFWHSHSTLFKGCISFKVLCREASFTSMKPPSGFGGNPALADWRERLLSRPWRWSNSSATISANMEQESNIQRKRVVYSILTVRHVVHDLYINMYASDQQPQHPHWPNQVADGVVVTSDIIQHIDFLSWDRQ